MTSSDGRPRMGISLGLGAVVGALAGFFGVGGGILIVPGLVLLVGMEQRRAHGTSLAAIAPIAAAGAVGYLSAGAVDWEAAAWLTAGSAIGATAGARFLARLPQGWLARAFAAFLVLSAVALPFQVEAGATASGLSTISWGAAAALLGIGIGAGTLAGILGVGGGIVTIPAMVLVLALSPIVAKGTSLIVIIPTAIAGTVVNVRRRHADVRVAASIAAAGAITAIAASFLAVDLDPLVSAILFGPLLLAVAIRMLVGKRTDVGADRGA